MTHLIRQMGYVVIATPDPEGSARDLADMTGVRITHRAADAAFVSSNARYCDVAYLRDARRGIRAVGLEAMDDDAVDEVYRRAKSEGLTILDDKPLLPKVRRAVRFATPFGPIFEVHTPIEREPIDPAKFNAARVRRLEHVNLRASDPKGFHDLVTRLLGMKLSDRTTGYERAWYRCADGYHHTFACGPGDGLHHYAFDAHALYDLAGVADALAAKGRSLLWGIGRHGPGNNLFSYYLDPNGCVVEVSFGLERIDNDALHEPGNFEFNSSSNVLDRWGSQPPVAYGKALTPFVP
ncbi:VOC family protein [Pseudorhodoplanes sp.]|uniref:VOC family protein n=1 Tax=Pseudorhodoplanes sp. TaxID=1934341 RepID=UPI002CB7E76E|nr:VOC family protein [Pseudorhodoplanes sp.]HWV41522.1 VOC family protein [Pseudorhodoplanes sp.]